MSENTIVRKNKSTALPLQNQIIRKVKLIVKKSKPIEVPVKIIKKTVTKISELDPTSIPQIEGSEIISEYVRKGVSEEDLSKEDMVEQVESQRDILIKNRDRYNEKDYSLKLSTIDQLLTKLRGELTQTNLNTMNIKRVQIDKIVLDKKIPEKQFTKKIDLTGDHDDKDPSMGVLSSSRKYFEKMGYLKPPPELAKIDPSKNKNKGFGNQAMPQDLLKTINFS